MIQAAGNQPQNPKSQQTTKQEDLQTLEAQMKRDPKFAALYMQEALATVSTQVLSEVDNMLKLMGNMTNVSAQFTLKSGQESLKGAMAQETASLAAGATSVGYSTAAASSQVHKSPEQHDLEDHRENLKRELKGHRSGASADDTEPEEQRTLDEIKEDLETVKGDLDDIKTRKQMMAQLPQMQGQALGQFINSMGGVAKGVAEMESASDQATADIARQLSDRFSTLAQQALQILTAVRQVDPYQAQVRTYG